MLSIVRLRTEKIGCQTTVFKQSFFIILQVDRASWHLAKRLQVQEFIRLLPQPPYSPKVMPVEHVWHEIREKRFENHIFKSLNAVEDILCEVFRELIAAPERLP